MKPAPTENNGYLAPTTDGALTWGPLHEGRLVRRYKRFLADVELADGSVITAHTPNTGGMIGCSEPGRPVWLSRHDNANRKYPFTLEMIAMPGALVGVNTGVPNKLVRAAALAGKIPEFPFPCTVRSEVTRGNSRLDLLIEAAGAPEMPVEIKNCTLVEKGTAFFPDAVTQRGRKHLFELAEQAEQGRLAVIFILIQRGDAERFEPADHIDPEWGAALRAAIKHGVRLLAYRADVNLHSIAIGNPVPVHI